MLTTDQALLLFKPHIGFASGRHDDFPHSASGGVGSCTRALSRVRRVFDPRLYRRAPCARVKNLSGAPAKCGSGELPGRSAAATIQPPRHSATHLISLALLHFPRRFGIMRNCTGEWVLFRLRQNTKQGIKIDETVNDVACDDSRGFDCIRKGYIYK